MSHTLRFWLSTLTLCAMTACLSRQAAEVEEFAPATEVGGDEDLAKTETVSKRPAEQTAHKDQDSYIPAAIPEVANAQPSPEAEPPMDMEEAMVVSGRKSKPKGGGITIIEGDANVQYGVGSSGSVTTSSDRSRMAAGGSVAKPRRVRGPSPRPRPAPTVAHNRQPMAPPPPPVRPDRTSGSEHYTDYGINGFDLVERDGLSTFAIDVDTASYTMSRRKLREGYLPPTASVRVEEYVNYFPYEYRRPTSGDPFTVDMEAAPAPWNQANRIVRVGVQGKKVSYDQRKSVHLTFLVDVSGSMRSADKIGLLKETLKMLTQELEDGDTVGIATYAGSTKVVLEPTPMSQKQDIIRALDRLTAGGSTAMGAGIDLAYGLADRSFVSGAVNRVIVCSDGDANVGKTSHQALSQKVKGYAQKGITLTTLGFGNGNYKDTMMERLSNDGDGNYYYIDSIMESRRIFVDKLTQTMEVIAKDVKIQVEWNPGAVIAYRLIGYENRDIADRDFRNDKVDAGEIGAGHQVTALYEVALKDNVQGSLGTVRIRNKAPGPDSPAVERSFDLPAKVVKSRFAESTDDFRIAVAAGTFAEILRASPHVQEMSLGEVASIARSAQRPEYPEDTELISLIERAAQLKGERNYSSR